MMKKYHLHHFCFDFSHKFVIAHAWELAKPHEPISLFQRIPVKDASALICKHHADAIGLVQEIKQLCLYDASSHWMVIANDEKSNHSLSVLVYSHKIVIAH